MTRRRSVLLSFFAVLTAGGLAAASRARAAAGPDRSRLAGRYDGGQMEMAAMLELGADGRFHYGLSYGALDEEARGRWEADGDRVLLTSDAVKAPRFSLVSAQAVRAPRLRVALDGPAGMNRQYFSAVVRFADGRTIDRQLSDEGLEIALGARDRIASVALRLGVFGLESEPASPPAGPGAEMRFRFEPNDLGKVEFNREPLAVGEEGLRLRRHDRTILFRRVDAE